MQLFCCCSVLYYTTQVCFVVSARCYPRQDVRVNYWRVAVKSHQQRPPFWNISIQRQEFGAVCLSFFCSSSSQSYQRHPAGEFSHIWLTCNQTLLYPVLLSSLFNPRWWKLSGSHTARAATSARRRRADSCQTISSSEQAAKRVFF